MLVVVFSRGSTKKSSGAAPLLVIVTGTVTGVPAASFVLALFGRPVALTLTSLNLMLPVNGWEISLPPPARRSPRSASRCRATGLRV